jgi:hypothetical protein
MQRGIAGLHIRDKSQTPAPTTRQAWSGEFGFKDLSGGLIKLLPGA